MMMKYIALFVMLLAGGCHKGFEASLVRTPTQTEIAENASMCMLPEPEEKPTIYNGAEQKIVSCDVRDAGLQGTVAINVEASSMTTKIRIDIDGVNSTCHESSFLNPLMPMVATKCEGAVQIKCLACVDDPSDKKTCSDQFKTTLYNVKPASQNVLDLQKYSVDTLAYFEDLATSLKKETNDFLSGSAICEDKSLLGMRVFAKNIAAEPSSLLALALMTKFDDLAQSIYLPKKHEKLSIASSEKNMCEAPRLSLVDSEDLVTTETTGEATQSEDSSELSERDAANLKTKENAGIVILLVGTTAFLVGASSAIFNLVPNINKHPYRKYQLAQELEALSRLVAKLGESLERAQGISKVDLDEGLAKIRVKELFIQTQILERGLDGSRLPGSMSGQTPVYNRLKRSLLDAHEMNIRIDPGRFGVQDFRDLGSVKAHLNHIYEAGNFGRSKNVNILKGLGWLGFAIVGGGILTFFGANTIHEVSQERKDLTNPAGAGLALQKSGCSALKAAYMSKLDAIAESVKKGLKREEEREKALSSLGINL